MISCIELSPHDQATAYVAATRYKLDDYQPYLYKTSDYGQTWQRDHRRHPRRTTSPASSAPTRPGRACSTPAPRPACTSRSTTAAAWQRFQLNLPVAPIHDLLIKDNDLIAGTHGRSIWILDDLTPLHQVGDATGATHLFKPRTTVRIGDGIDWSNDTPGKNYIGAVGGGLIISKTPENATVRKYLDVGQNPPKGAIITYRLERKAQRHDQPEPSATARARSFGNLPAWSRRPPKRRKSPRTRTTPRPRS